jgi:hypothetical protein
MSLRCRRTPDLNTGLDALTAVLTSADRRDLTEGFIVIEGGRSLGLGTGERSFAVQRRRVRRRIGAVTVKPGVFGRPEEVASAAVAARHEAKLSRIGLAVDVGSPAAEWHGLPLPRPAPVGLLRPAGPCLAQARTSDESFTAAKESR